MAFGKVVNISHFLTENWGRCNFGQNATIMCEKLPVTIPLHARVIATAACRCGFKWHRFSQIPSSADGLLWSWSWSISEQSEIQFHRQGRAGWQAGWWVGQGSNGPHGGVVAVEQSNSGWTLSHRNFKLRTQRTQQGSVFTFMYAAHFWPSTMSMKKCLTIPWNLSLLHFEANA